MASDPVPEPTTPEAAPPAPTEALTAATADGPTGSGGTSIAAGPAPQVLYTPDAAPTPAPAATPAAKPGEELIGSWLSAHLHRTDVPYAGLVVVLAFLLGSFAAFNPGIWLNLATGRLLSEGKYEVGVDPFAYTTKATNTRPALTWINHSWLFSWISYQLYNLDSSGALLVLAKALGIVGLGVLMLFMRPRNRHGWVGTLVVLLALLAMSPRFELEPVVVSILFLGVTLFILVRAGVFADAAESDNVGARPAWLWGLPVLFALWVNLDNYFILGPLTVLLCFVGLLVGKFLGHKPAVCLKRLGAVLVIGMVACLANPQHFWAMIRMPPEIGYLLLYISDSWPQSMVAGGQAYMDFHTAQTAQGGYFSRTLSPLTGAFLTEASVGKNVAGLGFFVLFVVVLASFIFCRPTRLSTLLARALPTGLLAILALMLARLIPFFAVVGGVMAMLNIQEYLARRETQEPAAADEQDLWANMARLGTGFLLFGLFFLAWPGWINTTLGAFDSQRRVAWGVAENASLKDAVKYLEKMHQDGKLDRCFNLTPDVASYGAWYAPGVKFFLDQRLELFDRDARMYNQLAASLFAETPRGRQAFQGKTPSVEWRKEFLKHKIDHVTGSNPLAFDMSKEAWRNPYPFELASIYADGKTYVIAWRPALKGPVENAVAQWQHEAFGKAEKPWMPSPPPQETDPSFWELYAFGQSQPPLAGAEAAMLVEYNRIVRAAPPWTVPYLFACFVTNPIQPLGPNPAMLCNQFWFAEEKVPKDTKGFQPNPEFWSLRLRILTGHFTLHGQDYGDPASLIVGIRKARDAIVESPKLGSNYRTLADLVESLDFMESYWSKIPDRPIWSQFPDHPSQKNQINLFNVRRYQYVAALKHNATLNPDDPQAHYRLFEFYAKQNFLDLALKHLRKSVELLENSRNMTNAILQVKNQREDIIQRLQQDVDRRMADLELRSKDLHPIQKAMMAALGEYKGVDEGSGKEFIDRRGMGLIGAAQKALEDIPPGQLDQQGELMTRGLSLQFALQTGDLARAEQIMPDVETLKKFPQFLHFFFILNAANGNYEEADKFLADMDEAYVKELKRLAAEKKDLAWIAQRRIVALLSFSQPGYGHLLYGWDRGPYVSYIEFSNNAVFGYYMSTADRHMLRAVFALETGNTVSARKLFQETLDIVGPDMPYFDRKIAERYHQLIEP